MTTTSVIASFLAISPQRLEKSSLANGLLTCMSGTCFVPSNYEVQYKKGALVFTKAPFLYCNFLALIYLLWYLYIIPRTVINTFARMFFTGIAATAF